MKATGGAYDSLSPKRRAFVDAFLSNGFNACQAAKTAGYKHPDRQGPALLGFLEVGQAVQERMAAAKCDADAALEVLSAHLHGDLGDFLEIKKEGDGEVVTLRTALLKAKEAGKLRLLRKVKVHVDGAVEVELYDAQAAADKLLRAAGRYVHKVEHSGPRGGPLEVQGTYDFSQLPLEARVELLRLLQAAKPAPAGGAPGDPGEAGEEGRAEG
jgi:phage terminase small subunit